VRLSPEAYYLEVAKTVAKRSTCPKKSVGAVLVRNGSIISTGYNGAPSGRMHCEDYSMTIGNACFPTDEGKCTIAVHAELNAILQAAKNGQATNGSKMYVTHKPCDNCNKAMINSGITEFQT